MRSRSVLIAVTVSVLSAAGAAACFREAHALRTEARWLMERGTAQADAYARTFDGIHADQELATFEARREVLARAHLWHRGQLLLVLLCVVSAFSSYVLYLFYRLRRDLEELDHDAVGVGLEAHRAASSARDLGGEVSGCRP